MFSEEVLEKVKAMEERWHRACLEAYGEREYSETTTTSGIPLKPVYTPGDIEDTHFEDIGLPGEYPYTRGTKLQGYRADPWMMRLGLGFGSGTDTRGRWDHMRKLGMRLHVGRDEDDEQFPRMNMLIDLPSFQGYDPDHPKARGRVGECGLSLSTIEDMKLLFDGLPLDKIQPTFILGEPTLAATAMYVVYAESRGYSAAQLPLVSTNVVCQAWYFDLASFRPLHALQMLVENINYRVRYMPLGTHTNITGYNPGEAGATPVQEVAFTLAMVICDVEECVKAGLDPDDVAPRFYYHPRVSLDFFEEIAKIRAYRRMWAKIFKERFGCKNPRSLKVVMQAQTAGLDLTAQEPLNNIIRATINTLATVLAGADAVWTSAYDEALGIPTEEAAQIALRTQQIIYHETNIPSVADPLGGSYYVEWLTNKIENEAWKLIEQIDKRGGYLQAWESGWLRSLEEKSANEWHESFRHGDRVKVGVNKYRIEEPQNISVFEVDPKVEQEAIERVTKFKAGRDNAATQEALASLKKTTEKFAADWPGSCGTLMPAILNAVRASATLGDIQGVLKEAFGCGYTF